MPTPEGLHVIDRRSEDPAAATVVVVHGAMDRSTSFGRVDRKLRHLNVVRYDRRGYGASVEVGIGSLDDHVADLLAVIGDRSVTVFGHSIGGVVALMAAQRAPEQVGSVLAYEAPSPWAPWWPSPAEGPPSDPATHAEEFMISAIGERFWNRLPARTRDARRAEGPALQADMASVQGTAPFDAAVLDLPVISAAGSETTWWHARASRELAEALPRGEEAVVAGASHGVHLTHPGATAHLVEQAVSSQLHVSDP